jgi:ADP-ribose pyrophosphatase YjhB (NUDIX family)
MPENRQYPARPWLAVGVVVISGGRVLLIKRGRPPGMGLWTLPGGGVDIGETMAAAAAREVLEETGIICHPTGVLTAVDRITCDAIGTVQYHYVIVDLLASADLTPPNARDDAAGAGWFTLAEALTLTHDEALIAVLRQGFAAALDAGYA